MTSLTLDGVKLRRTFFDNFHAPDYARWKTSYHWHVNEGRWGLEGRANSGERQIYANPALGDPDPFTYGNNGLTITARPITQEERAKHPFAFYDQEYISGLLTTEKSFVQAYGYFEAEMRLPTRVPSIWPAFWLLRQAGGLPFKAELDVMEAIGPQWDRYHVTTHWGSKEDAHHLEKGIKTDTTMFHRYGMLWLPDRIVYALDRKVLDVTRQPNPGLHQPMMLAINLAVGGRWPESVAGRPVFTDPVSMRVRNVSAWGIVPNVTL